MRRHFHNIELTGDFYSLHKGESRSLGACRETVPEPVSRGGERERNEGRDSRIVMITARRLAGTLTAGFRNGLTGALVCLLLAFAMMPGVPSAGRSEEPTVARDARIGGDRERTRFVADLSQKVDFRLFTLADPYRVIVDLPDVRFQLPPGVGEEGRGLVAAYRFGLIDEGKARIVIDLNAPAEVENAFVLEPKDGHPARLVIDLVRTDREAFMAALEKRESKRSKRKTRRPDVTLPSKQDKSDKPVVVIDPGHGGIDPGAVSRNGLKEKEVVFAFSRTLRDKLQAEDKYEVLLTRDIDTYVPLQERVTFARQHHGDLFLSIHADSLPGRYSDKISGATVYTLSEKASDAEAKALAKQENRSDVLAGVELPDKEDEVTGILIDLALRETKNLSITFADVVLSHLEGKTPLMKKAHRFAGFRVLKAPDIPSVLIELGYMSNPADIKNLTDAAWREKVAEAIAQSVDRFFKLRSRGLVLDAPVRRSSAVP